MPLGLPRTLIYALERRLWRILAKAAGSIVPQGAAQAAARLRKVDVSAYS
jgi:hypothetical protein